MNKHILILLAIITSNYAFCMKRPLNETPDEQASKKICSFEQPAKQYLPTEILISAFINSFKIGANFPRTVQNSILNGILVNKDFYRQINLPHNMRRIINFAEYTCLCPGFLANRLTLPAAKNYVQQSENLHTHINLLTHDQIRTLVSTGADVNYCSYDEDSKYSYPLLMHTRDDYGKTTLLLELGADSNITNGRFGVPSPFEYAVSTENIDLLKLYLAHHPRLKYLCTAIETKNDEIIALILLDKNIPLRELNKALNIVMRKTFNLSHAKLLLDAGADPTTALNTIANIKSFSHRHDPMIRCYNQHTLDGLTLDMIDLLCTYGAYDSFLHTDALDNNAPQKFIDSLEKGRRIVVEKMSK